MAGLRGDAGTCWSCSTWSMVAVPQQRWHLPLSVFPGCKSLSLSLELAWLCTYPNPSYKQNPPRAPGWLSRLGDQLQLRSWSHSSWVQALHRALCWQLRTWTLPWILCLPCSLPLPCSLSLSLSLCVSKINKHWKKIKNRTWIEFT